MGYVKKITILIRIVYATSKPAHSGRFSQSSWTKIYLCLEWKITTEMVPEAIIEMRGALVSLLSHKGSLGLCDFFYSVTDNKSHAWNISTPHLQNSWHTIQRKLQYILNSYDYSPILIENIGLNSNFNFTYSKTTNFRKLQKYKIKTEAIVFRKYRREVEAPIKIQNQIIPYNSSVKYLGLTLDSKLTFRQHTSKILNKSSFMLSVLYPFFKSHTLFQRIKVILYMAIIRSMLLYGCEAWSILADTHKRKFQVMQNKCLRIIFNAPRYTRNSDLHNLANLPYIEDLIENHVNKMSKIILTHENPLVREMGHHSQWRAKFRNIFPGELPEDTGIT